MAVTLIATGTTSVSSTTATATYSGSTISAGHVIVCFGLNSNIASTATCDDDAGSSNTYTLDDSNASGGGTSVGIFSCPIVDAIDNGTVFTVTYTAANTRKPMLVYHVDDLDATPFLENGRAAATTQNPTATLDGAPGVANTLTISATTVVSDGALAWTPAGTGGDVADTSNRSVAASWRYRTTNAAHSEGGSFTDTSANTATVVVCYEQVAGGVEYTQNPTGDLTTAGVLKKDTSHFKAGTLTMAGALARAAAHFKAGVLSFAGALGNVGPSAGVEYTQSLAGTITSSGLLTKAVNKFLAGTLTSSGVVAKAVSKFPRGTLTSSGAHTRAFNKFLAGTLSLASTLTKRVNKFLAGVLTLAGQGDFVQAGQPTQFTQSLAGTVTFAGGLNNTIVTPVEYKAHYLHRDVVGSPFAYSRTPSMGRGRR